MRLLPALLLTALLALRAVAGPQEDAVKAADSARVMATIAGDVARLDPLLSDALSYGHADGRVQTKADFLGAVKTNRVKYEAYDYEEANIARVDDETAIMTGRASLRAIAGDRHVAFRLRFLSVWRRESGAWRLFAYQSTPLSEPATAK